MKKMYLSLMFLFAGLYAAAQCSTVVLAGASTSSNGRGPSGSQMKIRTVYLITPAEMLAAGFTNGQAFSEIGWSNQTLPSAAANGTLNIMLENTSDMVYSKSTNFTTATAGMTSYRSAPTTLPAVTGFYSIPFTTTFTYTGGGVYVAFEWTNCTVITPAVVMFCNTALAGGLMNTFSTSSCTFTGVTMAATSFRPITSFGSTVANDAKVAYIYNQGELVMGKSVNVPFSATITNNSGLAMTNLPVSLQISGANSFTSTATIANLPACSTQVVSFTTPYTPTSEGVDSVMVFLPTDANPVNDTFKVRATVGKQKMAYRNVGENSMGGVGVNTGNGTIAIKFSTATPGIITHADVNFNTVTTPSQYRIAIYGDNAGVPTTIPIYVDALDRTNATGNLLIKLDAPVSVPAGTFYLALQQMSININMALGFTNEQPLRTNTYFFSSNPPLTWSDLGGGANLFKIISGVRFCYPITPNALLGVTTSCEGSSVLFRADTTGNPFATSFTWILPPGYIGNSVSDSIYVTVGATPDVIKCVANFPCGSSDTVMLNFTPTPLSMSIAQSNVGNTASNSGTQTSMNNHADGLIVTYSDASCQPIALIADTLGGNVLGMTNATVQVDASVSNYNGQPYLRRHFGITPQNNGDATVLLYISQADFTDYNTAAVGWPQLPTTGSNSDPNIPNIRISKVNGPLGANPPTVITPTLNWNAASAVWEVYFPVTSFSDFYIHAANPANQALPVVWQSFEVSKKENASLLNWVTSVEQNNSHFNIQHSTNGNHFETIGKISSRALGGNSSSLNNYDFSHTNPQSGYNYYRIEQVDQDNNVSYSQIRLLVWGKNGTSYTIYPQPANDIISIDAVAEKNMLLNVQLTDMTGKIIMSQSMPATKGVNNLSMNVGHVTNGLYFIRVLENNEISFTQKVTVRH